MRERRSKSVPSLSHDWSSFVRKRTQIHKTTFRVQVQNAPFGHYLFLYL